MPAAFTGTLIYRDVSEPFLANLRGVESWSTLGEWINLTLQGKWHAPSHRNLHVTAIEIFFSVLAFPSGYLFVSDPTGGLMGVTFALSYYRS
jgi:hypothetical protein